MVNSLFGSINTPSSALACRYTSHASGWIPPSSAAQHSIPCASLAIRSSAFPNGSGRRGQFSWCPVSSRYSPRTSAHCEHSQAEQGGGLNRVPSSVFCVFIELMFVTLRVIFGVGWLKKFDFLIFQYFFNKLSRSVPPRDTHSIATASWAEKSVHCSSVTRADDKNFSTKKSGP